MNKLKQLLWSLRARLSRERLRQSYWTHHNRRLFRRRGVIFGPEMNIPGPLYLSKGPQATIRIGHHFTFLSDHCLNPLSRNLRGSIRVENGATLTIGDNVGISAASIWCKLSIQIGNNVNIGADTILLDTDGHSLDHLVRRNRQLDPCSDKRRPIVIEDDVLIGARCIILKGVTIGARSIIGAGSVVTKNIPPDTIAAGNPAVPVRSRKPQGGII